MSDQSGSNWRVIQMAGRVIRMNYTVVWETRVSQVWLAEWLSETSNERVRP